MSQRNKALRDKTFKAASLQDLKDNAHAVAAKVTPVVVSNTVPGTDDWPEIEPDEQALRYESAIKTIKKLPRKPGYRF